MKVANNMDSVFAGFAKDELDFELMFDSDDCLIDLVAGVNEDGEYVTGANPEDNYVFQLDEDGNPLDGRTFEEVYGEAAEDPITDKCDTGRREGAIKDAGHDLEGTKKDQDAEFNTPEGMKSEVPGTNKSAESHAHDVTKEIEDAIKEAEDPITDKDSDKLRDGKEKYASNNVEGEKQEVIGAAQEAGAVCEKCGNPKESCTCKKEACKEEAESFEEAYIDFLAEEFNPSKETDDTFESKIKGDNSPIDDKDSDALRAGKEKDASNNVEGEKQEVIGAAQESCDGCDNIDKQLSDDTSDVTVPDKVQTDGAANIIPPDRETQSSDGVEPAKESVIYSGWITKVTEADEKVPLTSDDADIEAVANDEFDSEGELDLSVDYDDDELIDLAINGAEL